ncbi:MAG TPA: VWA domain-containing protein [Bryobacteraceae bacterium]|nr:VWA domain-containing protein [Bryobacteraceae bacterium]
MLLLPAQTPPQEVAIHSHPYTPPSMVLHAESNLVEVGLTVRDRNGQSVAGLQASDFEVLDNGVPQTITAFSELRSEGRPSATPAAPGFITFFFDDLHVGVPGPGIFILPEVKQAARAFATRFLKPGDRISIATTSGLGVLDFTDDARRFAEASDQLNFRGHLPHSVAEYQADVVTTLDSLRMAAKRLSEAPGARVLVFVSAGFVALAQLPGGRGRSPAYLNVEPQVKDVIETAVRGSVTIHVIDAKGLSTRRGAWILNQALQEVADGTGGHFFRNSNNLVESMERAAHPQVAYSLAFTPARRDGKFHTLKIRFTSKRADLLEFRPGYISHKDDHATAAPAAHTAMDEAVFSKQNSQDVPFAVALQAVQAKQGVVRVSVFVTVDVKPLPFATSHGRHMQQLVLLTVLLDPNGGFVTGVESTMDLALTDSTLTSFRKDGLRTVARLDAAPGIYHVRTVVREGMKGNLGASTAAVELRAR